MHSKILLSCQSRKRESIEGFHDEVIDFLVKFLNSFFPKCEMIGHVSSFVIPSQKYKSIWIIEFQSVEQDDSFH